MDHGTVTVGTGSAPSESFASFRIVGTGGDVPPRFLADYELLSEIARGGMGVVFRARQVKLNRLVALKLVRDAGLAGPSELRRFRTEAEAIAQLDHPNIVPIYEVGQVDGQPFFSMKLVEGGNLSRHIPRLKDDPRVAAVLMVKVALAIHYAHQRAILHRDIKPSNILLDEAGEPYVTDLGLAKRIDAGGDPASETLSGSVMGTPAYMPPEQAQGQTRNLTTTADVYSLGATLYETITGRPPFEAASIPEILRQVVECEPEHPRTVNPAIDRDLETICLKCLEKEPSRRYGSAEALADDLGRWLDGRPIAARRVSIPERAMKWVRRRPGLAALTAALTIAVVGLLVGGVWFNLRLQHLLDLANRGRYASDMSLARRALEDGLIYQVREQLAAYRDNSHGLTRLRGFEWYYLDRLCDPEDRELVGHTDVVLGVAFHPDGRRLFSAGKDRTVRVWDLDADRPSEVLSGHTDAVRCLAISRDGRWLATGDLARELRIWDLSTGRHRLLRGHDAALRSVAFSPDSRHLLSSDVSGAIVQWDVASATREFRFEHRNPETDADQPGNVRGAMIAYTPDGRKVVTAGFDEWVIVWDADTRQPLVRKRQLSNVLALSLSPDSRHIALATQSALIKVLSVDTLEESSSPFRGDSTGKMDVAYSPDGRWLATVAQGGAILIHDSKRGQMIDFFQDRATTILNGLAISPDSRRFASISRQNIHIRRVTRETHGIPIARDLGSLTRMAESADARRLALADDLHRILIWDAVENRVLLTLPGHELAIFGLAFVPVQGDNRLVTVGGDGKVSVWDTDTGHLLNSWFGHEGGALAVAIRPDGKQLATGGQDGMIRTWTLTTGRPDLIPIEQGGAVTAVAYSPDGSLLAAGGMDRNVSVWSASTGSRRLGPLLQANPVSCLAFSPDGRVLAAGGGVPEHGGEVKLWDASWGTLGAEIKGARGIRSLSFTPDAQRIATCGRDSVVQVWDASSGHETLTLILQRQVVQA